MSWQDYLYGFLVSATGLALVGGAWRTVRKYFSGASMRAKDVYAQMQDQRDEALDENELLRTERDQALRMVMRRDRVIITELGEDKIPDDRGDSPYQAPPREPRRRGSRRKIDDPSE